MIVSANLVKNQEVVKEPGSVLVVSYTLVVVTRPGLRGKKWLRKSEQGDKWNRCLIEGMIVPSETGARDEQTTPP